MSNFVLQEVDNLNDFAINAGCDFWNPVDIMTDFYGQAIDNSWTGLIAFAYLWRRFGPPEYGSDDYKDMGCYFFTTPDPDVIFGFYCKPNLVYSLTIGLKREIYNSVAKDFSPEHKEEAAKIEEKVNSAVRQGLAELLKPTNVRDWEFNIIGEPGNYNDLVPYSKYAGWGVDRKHLEKQIAENK